MFLVAVLSSSPWFICFKSVFLVFLVFLKKKKKVKKMQVDPALLRFCLQHSDGEGLREFGERPKEDWVWLKEALANFETPGKKVQKLVEELKEAKDTEKILFCLDSLNEEIDDVDQSSVVANAGGVELLLALCRHADKQVRLAALSGVQLLVKNNEPLILLAKKLGAVPHLMQLLVNPQEDVTVRSRALSSISALIENQPDLQDLFVNAKVRCCCCCFTRF